MLQSNNKTDEVGNNSNNVTDVVVGNNNSNSNVTEAVKQQIIYVPNLEQVLPTVVNTIAFTRQLPSLGINATIVNNLNEALVPYGENFETSLTSIQTQVSTLSIDAAIKNYTQTEEFAAQLYFASIINIPECTVMDVLNQTYAAMMFTGKVGAIAHMANTTQGVLLTKLGWYVSRVKYEGFAIRTQPQQFLAPAAIEPFVRQFSIFKNNSLTDAIVHTIASATAEGQSSKAEVEFELTNTIKVLYNVQEQKLFLQNLTELSGTYNMTGNYTQMAFSLNNLTKQETQPTEFTVSLFQFYKNLTQFEPDAAGAIAEPLQEVQQRFSQQYGLRDLNFLLEPTILTESLALMKSNNVSLVNQTKESAQVLVPQIQLYHQLSQNNSYIPQVFIEATNANLHLFIDVGREAHNSTTLSVSNLTTIDKLGETVLTLINEVLESGGALLTSETLYPALLNLSDASIDARLKALERESAPFVQQLIDVVNQNLDQFPSVFLSDNVLKKLLSCPLFMKNKDVDFDSLYYRAQTSSLKHKRSATTSQQFVRNVTELVNTLNVNKDLLQYESTLVNFLNNINVDEVSTELAKQVVKNALWYLLPLNDTKNLKIFRDKFKKVVSKSAILGMLNIRVK